LRGSNLEKELSETSKFTLIIKIQRRQIISSKLPPTRVTAKYVSKSLIITSATPSYSPISQNHLQAPSISISKKCAELSKSKRPYASKSQSLKGSKDKLDLRKQENIKIKGTPRTTGYILAVNSFIRV